MGEFVKELLEKRHINVASMGSAMVPSVKSGTIQNYYKSAVISDDVLDRMTRALGFDLRGMVQDEQARRSDVKAELRTAGSNQVAEEAPPYVRRPSVSTTGGSAYEIVLKMEEWPEDVQLRILKFLQQQPKRGVNSATGS